VFWLFSCCAVLLRLTLEVSPFDLKLEHFKLLLGLFKDLNESQKKELQAIMQNQDLTRKQSHEQVEQWVAKQDDKVKVSELLLNF
jgi:hypothetical protein